MVAPRTLTSDQVLRMRLDALGLTTPGALASASPEEVVRHHLAMQAQDFRASRWAIGSRTADAVDDDVRAAYDEGRIVRSWPMRGTVHATCAEDLPWMLSLMGVRALSGVERRREALGIDEAFLEQARSVAMDMLRGGGRCTRAEYSEALNEAGLDMSGQRLYHTVWYLSQTGTLVQGPIGGDDHQLVLLDEWIPAPRQLTRAEALAELGQRYLQARGPATVDDLVHWTKLSKTDCRKALAADGKVIVEVDGPGGPFAVLRTQLETLDKDTAVPADHIMVLAAFDEHLLGYRVRDCQLDPAHATLVDPGRNGVFRWTIVRGGRVIGTWKRVRRTRHVVAEATLFPGEVAPHEEALQGALDRWGAFEGTDVTLRWVS